MKSRSDFNRLIYCHAALAVICAAAGVFISFNPKFAYLQPKTLFLQSMPLAGLLTAFLAPESFSKISGNFLKKVETYPKIALTVTILIAGIILIWVNRAILLSFMNSADENSCYFFAQCLKAGKWWTKPHELKDFFETAHIGAIGDKWFSVYPPGWPLVWAAALKLHLKDAVNPLLTALSLIFLFDLAKKIYSAPAFFLAATVLLISPFFLLTGAAYYSHNLCLFLMLAFWSCFLRWRETSCAKWAALAGLILGYAFATRYLTAAALGFLPCAAQLLRAARQRGKALSSFIVFAIIFAALIGLQLLYNRFLTGSFLDAPNHYLHAHEKLGFIPGYPPKTALDYLWKRFLYLLDWTPPGWLLLFLAAIFTVRPKSTEDLFLRITVFLLPAAYFFYYSWGGNQYGPRYLFESYPFLVLAASAALMGSIQGAAGRKNRTIVLVLFSFLAAIPIMARHLVFFKEMTQLRKKTYTLVESMAQKPALVFVSGFWGSEKLAMAPEDLARNSPFLDGEIIYARDMGTENAKLVSFFPGRHYYRASYDQASNQSRIDSLSF